jgi:transposase, IS30 family
MGTRYSHLSLEERCRLRGMMEMGLSLSEIARRLGRHRSTVQRELGRNRRVDGYRPDSAQRRAWACKLRGSKIARSPRLRGHVADRLALGWSPAQIAGRMELDGAERSVSVEYIYRHACSPAGRRAGLPRMLAQRKPKRGRRRRNGRREPAIPNRTPIHQRSTKAHLRSQFGHWEGGLMHFRRQRDILLTLQERRSRRTLARRPLGKDGPGRRSHRRGTGRTAGHGPPHDHPRQRRRVRAARGRHRRHRSPSLLLRPEHSVAARLDQERQRADPPRPSPQDQPRRLHRADIDDVIWNLNATPRKCLAYRTPIEAFAANLATLQRHTGRPPSVPCATSTA